MAGCVPCFIIPLLLFIFHRYIQPIILKFWNPWQKVEDKNEGEKDSDSSKKIINDSTEFKDILKGNVCYRK
ncbi:hypothetical protein RI129_001615 [Pyrocoelia pectoralis]|uniref:Uncharacterized protein n=1 Tax=Pyrocoelia pectoralis TaxID=417401 RepID=A0AAN7ZXH2_9COLE